MHVPKLINFLSLGILHSAVHIEENPTLEVVQQLAFTRMSLGLNNDHIFTFFHIGLNNGLGCAGPYQSPLRDELGLCSLSRLRTAYTSVSSVLQAFYLAHICKGKVGYVLEQSETENDISGFLFLVLFAKEERDKWLAEALTYNSLRDLGYYCTNQGSNHILNQKNQGLPYQ